MTSWQHGVFLTSNKMEKIIEDMGKILGKPCRPAKEGFANVEIPKEQGDLGWFTVEFKEGYHWFKFCSLGSIKRNITGKLTYRMEIVMDLDDLFKPVEVV